MTWSFFNERCMHCGDAGCMKVCPSPGALYRTKDGIVAFNKEKCISCKYCVSACPFNIPRYGADDKVGKCHLCMDRVGGGMTPACAKACPTETLKFGNRSELIAKAKAAKKTLYGENDLIGTGCGLRPGGAAGPVRSAGATRAFRCPSSSGRMSSSRSASSGSGGASAPCCCTT